MQSQNTATALPCTFLNKHIVIIIFKLITNSTMQKKVLHGEKSIHCAPWDRPNMPSVTPYPQAVKISYCCQQSCLRHQEFIYRPILYGNNSSVVQVGYNTPCQHSLWSLQCRLCKAFSDSGLDVIIVQKARCMTWVCRPLWWSKHSQFLKKPAEVDTSQLKEFQHKASVHYIIASNLEFYILQIQSQLFHDLPVEQRKISITIKREQLFY